MISFLKQFRLILMDKGTNVVYRVKDLIGYEYTDIYTLVMVKQQAFDQNGFPIYNDDGTPKQNIVFRRLGTTEDNTSYFKYRDSKETYSLEEITSGDPRWWNTPEVEEMLSDMNYTLSNSKYIQLSTHMSMSDIYWQCIILLRGLLDNRGETQYAMVDVNLQSNSMQQISVFEAVLILEILMDWHIQTVRDDPDTLQGNMYLTNGMVNGESVCLDLLFNGLSNDGLPNPLIYGRPFQVSSFNFDIKKTNPTFYEGLSAYEYLEPSTFIPMLENVLSRDQLNIGETMMVDVRAIYDYLVLKLRDTRTIHEFRQVSDVFEQLFLVHPDRKSWYYADGESAINIEDFLCDTFHISVYDLNVLCKLMETEYVKFTYDDTQYSLNISELLTNDVSTLDHFDNRHFVNALILALSKYTYNFYDKNVSPNLKSKYREIIITKIQLDLGNDVSGPKTFEALLMRENPELYRYIQSIRYSTDVVIYAIRAIIRALERYTNASLQALEFSALGEKEYFKILKEVISYFKSYMVEFSKDEFVYIFDGFYDCGGHPNMLKLFDGENQLRITLRPTDSLTLHDASYTSTHTSLTDTSNTACNLHIPDQGISNAYDEMLIRYRASYKKIKQAGYPILFDDGESIKSTPPYDLVDDESLIFTFSQYQLDNTNIETDTGKYIVIHLHQYKRN